MIGLPIISGLECVAVLKKIGYRVIRQKGSHIIMRKDDPFSQITVPEHKTLDRGTLRAIIRQSGISIYEFNQLLN